MQDTSSTVTVPLNNNSSEADMDSDIIDEGHPADNQDQQPSINTASDTEMDSGIIEEDRSAASQDHQHDFIEVVKQQGRR